MAFPTLLAAADGAVLQILGGDPVRYAPSPGAPFVDVAGLFDLQHHRVDVLDTGVTTAVPALFVREDTLAPHSPATDVDPMVVVGGQTYRVREAKRDGLGGMILMLQEMGG